MLLEGQIFRTPELLWKAKVSESFEGAWSENLLMPDTWITRLKIIVGPLIH